MTTTVQDTDLAGSVPAPPKSRIGVIVATSMAAGLMTAMVTVPFLPAKEDILTGAVLLGFALGWALLAVLSVRFTDQPQRWAAAPAVFLAVAGVAGLSGSAAVHHVLAWVWPPALFGLVVWMVLRVRGQLRSRSARWLLYPVLTALAISSVGGGYETVRESLDTRAYPMPGQLIDVGGHRLHLNCTGSGSPTVVLEPGLGGASSDMAWIAPAVARDSRVCVYDRAGRGWSDAAEGPQDGAHIAADLHTLLDRAHVPGPYVLAGHSFGGLYVQSFAARYPDQVAGLVLLDSTAPKPGPGTSDSSVSSNILGRVSALVPAVAHLGAGRLLAQSSYASLPPRTRDEARANASTARNLGSFIEEFLEGNTSTQQAAELTDLNGKPLIVVTADTGNAAGWQAQQDHLATLSTNSLHRVALATTHESLLDDETDSAAASQAIHDVVESVRTSRPLATH
ncbi:MAG TPA: alpha/beta fold hydrolase [Microlunatus sp.]|nr:alpha/beta fold hydrolase [Microlunatus sp.]